MRLAVYRLVVFTPITCSNFNYCNQEFGIIEDFKIVDIGMINDVITKADYILNIERVLSWLRIANKAVTCYETG